VDHRFIEEHDIVARYGTGKLSPAECVRFEEHLVDCPECQQQIVATEDFLRGLRTVVAEDAAPARSTLPSAWLSPVRRWQPVLVGAAACALVLALPVLIFLRGVRSAQRELGEMKQASESWQRRYEAQQQAGAQMDERLRELERKVKENVLSTQLPVVATVFPLNTVRSGQPGGSRPVNRITISRAPQWIVFSPELEEEQHFPQYRATLSEAGGRIVWKQTLTSASANALAISLSSSLFHEGDYVLVLEGQSKPGRQFTTHVYPFHITLVH
jgi:hypothetical protein